MLLHLFLMYLKLFTTPPTFLITLYYSKGTHSKYSTNFQSRWGTEVDFHAASLSRETATFHRCPGHYLSGQLTLSPYWTKNSLLTVAQQWLAVVILKTNRLDLILLEIHFMIYLELKFLPKVTLSLEDTLTDYCGCKNLSLYVIHSKGLCLSSLCIVLICYMKIHNTILFFKAASEDKCECIYACMCIGGVTHTYWGIGG